MYPGDVEIAERLLMKMATSHNLLVNSISDHYIFRSAHRRAAHAHIGLGIFRSPFSFVFSLPLLKNMSICTFLCRLLVPFSVFDCI